MGMQAPVTALRGPGPSGSGVDVSPATGFHASAQRFQPAWDIASWRWSTNERTRAETAVLR